MMNLTILAVGNCKEKYLTAGIQEYAKRIGGYAKLDIVEVAEEKLPQIASTAEVEVGMQREGERLLAQIPKRSYVIALCVEGKQQDSEAFAANIEKLTVDGVAHICFVIGGSNGLSPEVKRVADRKLSFSKMTFPHQLMRLILVEQVYRAFRIIRNEPYHK